VEFAPNSSSLVAAGFVSPYSGLGLSWCVTQGGARFTSLALGYYLSDLRPMNFLALQIRRDFLLPSPAREAIITPEVRTKAKPMGLMDYLKTQLLDIIQWEDDSRDTLSWRFPDDDKEIKRGAQLIVRESQIAQFIYLGQFGDTFGPGKYTLVTDNIPILSTLKGWKYGFESPFKADVYFVNTRLFTGNKWGTSNPVMMRDSDFGIVRTRAFGTYDFRVVEPKLFLKEVAGTDHHFTIEEFADTMRSRIVSVFSDALASAKVPVLDVAARYSDLGEALLPLINPALTNKYGIEMPSFIVENVSLPPEVEQAIDKRSSMAAIGNLNDYVKLQMAEGLGKGQGGGPGGAAAEIAMGMGMAQQLMNQPGGILGPTGTPSAAPASATSPPVPGVAPAHGLPELLSPADAARALGVTEADVMASLSDGSLKGKKIGTAWRITRAALEEFLKS
jgi:excisionase family DNA binding protein